VGTSEIEAVMQVEKIYRFDEVFADEVEAINARRTKAGRTDLVALEVEDASVGDASGLKPAAAGSSAHAESSAGVQDDTHFGREPILRPTADSNVIGLALSGGGVRSASFCLGALQALDKAGVLKNIDYLSTVSGGGYIGTSLSAAMTRSEGRFPFQSSLAQDEPYSVQHIRNHSNYLFPRGSINVFYNVAIYLRGLLANALLLLPWLLFAAAITIFIKPTTADLQHPRFLGRYVPEALAAGQFSLTLILLYLFVLLLLAWGLWRSLEMSGWAAEIGSHWTKVCAGLLIILLIIGFCELQPIILKGIFDSGQQQTNFSTSLVGWLQGLAVVLAPFSAAVAFLSRHIGGLLKEGAEKPSFIAVAMRAVGKAAVYVAGAAIPILLWLLYLYFCFLGIKVVDSGYHAPQWIIDFSGRWFPGSAPIGWFYVVTGFALFVASLLLAPNANSLHRLYRDRLSKAFLFDPTTIEGRPPGSYSRAPISKPVDVAGTEESMKYENFELAPLDRFKLSEISCTDTPYHLINTALNIQGSKYANRRGRNADFFIFSPRFIGSGATKYVRTKEFEDQVHELDLATAMAVSGAAASSNMGANSIKALTPTLAILNVRLGYWVANPRLLALARKPLSIFDQLYFLQELFGLMRENSDTVYLTDGGHIENLGIYELLRRRCRLIIAVDAEADPEMAFRSLVALQRYARIDLGVLIALPWAEIRDGTRAASEEIAKSGGLPPHAAPHGPHCAVGEIIYPQNQKGILLYVKSSITGDENDYIVDYKRRFPSYPHETTADQLFSEEQFEAYRALGFHAVNELFLGNDNVGMRPKPAPWQGAALADPLVKAAKDLLKWSGPPGPQVAQISE
jgi:predicted acylesterase/phospholipase RssA